MLRRLTIRNLAIIDELEMELGAGLTVITGETGAGKSILVDALTLVAGGRGSSDLVRKGADRLTVSAELETDPSAREILEQAGLAPADTTLLKREFGADGRGRAFVNDEPAAVRTLSRLAEHWIVIAGQNSEVELADRRAALELLDEFARDQTERAATAAAAAAWGGSHAEVEKLETAARDRASRLDLLDFQIREIESAAPSETEESELLAERERLVHADRIRRAGESALAALSEDEGSAADRVGEAARAFAELAAIDPRESAHRDEAEELKRRIRDLAAAARDAASQIEADPDRLTRIETRLDRIDRIKKKYGGSVAHVLSLLARLRAERDELADVADALERRRKEEGAARDAYLEAARALSQRRSRGAKTLGEAVERQLSELALEKARFRVVLEPVAAEGPRGSGLETAVFLFAPNPGEPEKPVERIASGGELSRLQLSIRCAAEARKRAALTLVFDEVDAGIGGRTAEVVGRKLRELAARDQVLCVTHVPQIAALADTHFRAEKRAQGGRTTVSLSRLAPRDRVDEIARMLAGEKVPETALKHARALLGRN